MFEFGIRNVMRMNYTRYVALPPAWVDSELGAGRRIRVLMDEENRLVLQPVKDEYSALPAPHLGRSNQAATSNTPESVIVDV